MQAAASTDGDDSILNEWYKKDSNAVPPVYQLQPITNKFPNYISKDQALREKDRDGWWQTFQQLQRVLWRCARRAHKEGRMSAEQAHSYQMSGTTCMISHVQSQHYRDRVYPVTFTTFTVMLSLDASYSCSYSITCVG